MLWSDTYTVLVSGEAGPVLAPVGTWSRHRHRRHSYPLWLRCPAVDHSPLPAHTQNGMASGLRQKY